MTAASQSLCVLHLRQTGHVLKGAEQGMMHQGALFPAFRSVAYIVWALLSVVCGQFSRHRRFGSKVGGREVCGGLITKRTYVTL
jgi:hypothetical protein